ncbi:MAG TPA: hypothetical protein PK867_31455 [Pirellulales bacterium]|nr:hypothetical protein [Pirellulales bacterium]
MRLFYLSVAALAPLVLGCGTTKWSDTARTATEQLLLSTAIDRAVGAMDFAPLTDKFVYLDVQYLDCEDNKYVVSTLRQHMLAEGCVLMPDPASADYVVEVRSGAVGTDHHDVLVGVPAISVPTGVGSSTGIPEIPFAKSTAQKGIAKIACFAYNRETGQAVWQSGAYPVVSTAKDSWFLGTGPFQRGTIYDGTHFAGSRFMFMRKQGVAPLRTPDTPLTTQAVFPHRPALVRKRPRATEGKDAPKSAGGGSGGSQQTVSGSSGPSLPTGTSTSGTGGPSGNTSGAGTSTGLPAGQVVRLPALPAPQSTSGGSNSGGLSLIPDSWLKLK